MLTAIQIKLLAAILAVLVVIAGVLVRGGRTEEVTPVDRELSRQIQHKMDPPAKPYMMP